MFVRRRPLLRAAVIGGGAYVAGKRSAERSATAQQQEAEQDQRIDDLEQGQGQGHGQGSGVPRQAPPAAVPDQLSQLSELHSSGALTDAEFASAKARLLGTGS